MKRKISLFVVTFLFTISVFGGEIFSPGNASFSGFVKNSNSVPIINCPVYAYDSLGNVAAFMETDSSGYYIISGIAAGTYRAKTANQSGYIDLWYINGNSWGQATPFTITDGDTTLGINFTLNYGGSIEGNITNDLNEPLSGVYVDVYDTSQNFVTSSTTDSMGTYIVEGLQTGKYKLHTENYSGYINQWYNNKASFASADKVTVTEGDTVSGISLQLKAGGVIEGHVIASDSGTPITGVTVSLYNMDQTLYKNTQTDSSGFYILSSVDAGTYKLGTYNAFGFIDEFYNNQPTFESGDTLSVNGDTLTGINFSLIFTGIPLEQAQENKNVKVFLSGRKLVVNNMPFGVKLIKLYSINGRAVLKENLLDKNTEINLGNLKSGVYFIKITGDVRYTGKVIYIK